MDLVPHLRRCRWQPYINLHRPGLLEGVKLGDRTYKNHLDGYDQMAAITGKGPSTRQRNLLSRAKAPSALCALTITSFDSLTNPQAGSVKRLKPDVPYITNLRLDPFERTGWPK